MQCKGNAAGELTLSCWTEKFNPEPVVRGSISKIVSIGVCLDCSCNCGAAGDTGRLLFDGDVVCADAGVRNDIDAYAASSTLKAVRIPMLLGVQPGSQRWQRREGSNYKSSCCGSSGQSWKEPGAIHSMNNTARIRFREGKEGGKTGDVRG